MKRKKKSAPLAPSFQELQAAQLAAFQPLLAAHEFAQLQAEIERPLLPTLRINPLKTTPELVNELALRYGWGLENLPFCPEGYRVDVKGGTAVSAALEHKTGLYYIQEAASMLPVGLFDVSGDDGGLSLDLAASPGGKTTHLVARQADRGLVIANDSSQGRIQALKVVLQHWGGTNAAVTRFPGEQFGAWFPNTFDRALIDAPCSMQGLRTAESHEARPVTDKESRALAKRQQALLASALSAVHPGGEVVYSTCTLMPAENEGVVDAVLSRFGSSVRLLNAQRILPAPAPGISSGGDGEYLHDMAQTVRLWPHRYATAGFFACLFQKVADLGLPAARPPEHSMEAAGFFELSRAEAQQICAAFLKDSGYDLAAYLEQERRALVKRDARIFLFPRLLLERFRSLPVQSAGMLLGEWEGGEFVPSHEWVLRFGRQCPGWLVKLDEEPFGRFCRGEDLEGVRDSLSSSLRVVADVSGRLAGRARIVGGQIKNLSSRQISK